MNRNDTYSTVRFGDMVQNINERILPEDAEGLPYVGLEHLDPESLKIRRWGTPDEVEAQKLRFYTGDIIFGKRRYYQKKLAVADFDGICSAHAMVLRAKPNVVLPEFLPFFMQSEMFFERAMAISVGSLSPTINWSTLAKQEFPLPPMDEQRRIAEILWALEETYDAFQHVYLELGQVKKSFVESAFSTSDKIACCGDFTEFITTGSRGWAEHYVEAGSIFLRVTNLTRENTELDLSDLKYVIPPETTEKHRTRVKPGDLLVSASADLGRVAVIPHNFPEAYINQHVAIVRFRDEVNARYVANYFLSRMGQRQFLKYNEGGTKSSLNFRGIQSLQFPFIEKEHQENILRSIDEIDSNITKTLKHLEAIKTLKTQLIYELLSVKADV